MRRDRSAQSQAVSRCLDRWQAPAAKATRILATWDDHDYGENDAGSEYPHKETSKLIVLNFFEVAKNSPRRKRDGVYHAEVIGPPGQRVQVILLDTRYNRSPLVWQEDQSDRVDGGRYLRTTDPAATILGAKQWEWLEEQLRASAQVRSFGSSIQVVEEDTTGETWANFPWNARGNSRSSGARLARSSSAVTATLPDSR